MGISKTSDHIWIKIKMPNLSQKPPAPTNTSNHDLKDMDVLCNSKIKTESQNLEYRCIKDHWSYPNQEQDAKPKSGTFNVLQSPKSGLKEHGFSLGLQNQDRAEIQNIGLPETSEPQYQEAKLQSETSRILKTGLKEYGCSLHLQNQDREPKFGSWM